MPSRELAKLVEVLAGPLRPFTKPGSGDIGFSLHDFMPGMVEDVTIERFASDLVRTAAVLGSGHTLAVSAWMAGEAAAYEHIRVLRGVSVPERVRLGERITFEELSKRGADLVDYTDDFRVTAADLMGQPVMRTAITAEPVFYMPEGNEKDGFGRRGRRQPKVDSPDAATGQRFDDLLNALSLACSSCVQVVFEWHDYADEMLLMRGGGSRSGPMMYNVPRWGLGRGSVGEYEITRARLAEAGSILRQMAGRRDLDVAIARWKNSMIALDEANRIIDLRTVLESLYCRGDRNELKLRTTLRGALHLAPTLGDRPEYYSKLRSLYDLASGVVHGRRISDRDDVDALVAWSYSALRGAILKRLAEGPNVDWNALMLGLPATAEGGSQGSGSWQPTEAVG